MTIINPLIIPPAGGRAYNHITPFTYRDGLTYIEVLERLRAYIRDVVVPAVDGMGEFVIEQISLLQDEVDNQLAEQDAEIDGKLADQIIEFNDILQQVINNSIELQDDVLKGIINNPSSDARTTLDGLYANRTAFETVEGTVDTGRLSVAALDAAYIQPGELSTAVNSLRDETTATIKREHRPELVNPSGLDRFRKRLGEAFFTPLGIICQGDSITDGAWANGTLVNSVAAQERWAAGGWPGQLRQLFKADYGYAGEQLRNFTEHDLRWTLVGESGRVPTGVASTAMRLNSGGHATTTVPAGTTSVDVPVMFYPDAGLARTIVDGVDATPTRLTGTKDAMTAGWAATGGTVSYDVQSGVNVVKVAQTASGPLVLHSGFGASNNSVNPGQWLAGMIEARSTTNNRTLRASIFFMDSAGTIINGTEVMGDDRAASVNGWMQVGVIAQAPANAAYASLAMRVPSGGISGDAYEIKNAKLPQLIRVREGSLGARFVTYRVPLDGSLHTVRILGGAGVATDVVGLIETSDPQAKIRIHGSALSSSTTQTHARPEMNENGRLNLLLGTYIVPEAAPALVIIMLGANDYNNQTTNGITPDVYKANLELLLATLRDLGCSTLLVAGPRWADDSKPFNQDSYYAKAKELAQEWTHVSFIDLKEVWGSSSSAAAKSFVVDDLHPSLAGAGNIALTIKEVLTRPTVPTS